MATSKFLSDVSVDGKVGINTTSPGSTLEVKGNSTDGWIKLSTTSGNPIITSTNNLSFSVGNTNELLYLNNTNSSVGIGTTSPNALLHVYSTGNGEIEVERASGALFNIQSQSALAAIGTDSNHPLYLKTNAGTRAVITTAGNVGIGTTSPAEKLEVSGNILASGDITAYSDARIKENVETLPNALESVKAMRGVTYNKIGEEKQSIGVIAQEVQAVLPQLVSEHKDEMLSVAYGNITAVLIEAIKEQQDIISQLEERIIDLENRF